MPEVKPTILIVDDELSIRESFSLILEDDYRVITAASGEAALKKILDEKVDLIYLDIRMPGMDGMETLRKIREIDREITVVMVTAVNEVQKAGEAIKLGAYNYVVKPFDVDLILSTTKQLLEKKNTLKQVKLLFDQGAPQLLGQSLAITELNQVIGKISKTHNHILLQGEPGVEVELIASLIHINSSRQDKSFMVFGVPYNTSISELRKSLFGSGKGAFIGELEREIGVFEKCHEGTILLENIENLPKALQIELAQSIKNKEIKRDGSLSPIPIDLIFICSTTRNLKELVAENYFDSDLYSMISKVQVNIPPLRQRGNDISILSKYLIEKYNRIFNKKITGLSNATLEVLMAYSFPGNTWELKNLIKRAFFIKKEGEITPADLPIDILMQSRSYELLPNEKVATFYSLTSAIEKEYLNKALDLNDKDQEKTAKMVGLNPSAFITKLE